MGAYGVFLYVFFIWRYKAISTNNKDLPINEEIKVPEAGPELANFWAYLYDSLEFGKEFPVTDNDILAIMRTISTVKAQNKYMMK